MSDPVISQSGIDAGLAMAGIYYRSDGETYGASLLRILSVEQLPDNPFPFFLSSWYDSVCCSSAGLILCRSLQDANEFYIINPFTANFVMLPPPPIAIPANCPVALVCFDGGAAADGLYICEVICAISHPDFRGRYRLCVFSTLTQQYWLDNPLARRYGNIIPNSGISCGTMAYFRTEHHVIEIDANSYRSRKWKLPQLCLRPGTCVQLGCIKGELYLVAVTSTQFLIFVWRHWGCWYLLQHELGHIVTVGSFSLSGHVIKPLRFESERYEFPLLVDGRLVILESTGFPIPGRIPLRAWALQLPLDEPEPECAEDCVAFLHRPNVSCHMMQDP